MNEQLLSPFTFVIAGPIKSRFNEQIGLEALQLAKSIISDLNPSNEIIISTYKDEWLVELEAIADSIIINPDPGADKFKTDPWPMSPKSRRVQSNTTRQFSSALKGVEAARNDVVIKSRIELLPENAELFAEWISKISEELSEGKVAFFLENYTGINFSINGLLGMIPDTLVASNKQTGVYLWRDSLDFWIKNREYLTRRSIRYPATVEQIIGFNYLSRHKGFRLQNCLVSLRRQYISLELFRKVYLAEQDSYIFTLYRSSGFSKNYFKGLIALRLPEKILPVTKRDISTRIIVLFGKKVWHHYRRLLRAYKILVQLMFRKL